MNFHIPVLLHEVLSRLDPKPGEVFVDGTVGCGGHAIEIARRISPGGTLFAIDRDEESIVLSREFFLESEAPRDIKIFWKEGSYADIRRILVSEETERTDGILLDLGFSTPQIESPERGFSFSYNGLLDMRYSKKDSLTAAQVIDRYSEKDLANIFFNFGEEKFSGRIAKAIVRERKKRKLTTTEELARVVEKAVPRIYRKRVKIHPATRVFQALRIEVNQEIEHLKQFLSVLPNVMKPGGRVVIISFHSGEDRIVKNEFKSMETAGLVNVLTKKPIIPSKGEIEKNFRSRSAKLRSVLFL